MLYTHVLLASENDLAAYRRSGIARDLNRANVDLELLDAMLADPKSRAARALRAIRNMLRRRASSDAFHPGAPQRVRCQGPVVIIERFGSSSSARVLLNVSTEDATVESVTVPALGSLWMV